MTATRQQPLPAVAAVQAAEAMRRALADYSRLVEVLGRGGKLPLASIEETLAAAGRSAEELVRDVFGEDGSAMPWPGKPCPHCRGGRLRIYRSERLARTVRQYFDCGACRRRPEHYTRCLPSAAVPRRTRLRSTPSRCKRPARVEQ